MSMCWSEGAYVNWPSTPGGNEIKQVSLSPGDVVSTANTMISIASRMQSASTTLQELANSDDGQQGKAVQALRDSVGDTWEILGDAGDMYYHTADAIRTYGQEIGDVGGIAEALSSAYTIADEKWSTYAGADGDLHGDIAADPDDDDPNAESDASDNKAKYDAFQAWMNAANQWDQHYDDWETAWNNAVSAIENAHEHGPKDGWSEWFGDFLEIAYLVLTIAAIVLAVVFIVCTFWITGPIAAAIAGIAATVGAIVGIATAVVSIVRFARGETDLLTMVLDIAFAIPGIGPVANLITDMGPLVGKLGIGAAGLTGRVMDSMFPAIVYGSNFAEPLEALVLRGGVGASMLFDVPNLVKFGQAVDNLGIEYLVPQLTVVYGTNGLLGTFFGSD